MKYLNCGAFAVAMALTLAAFAGAGAASADVLCKTVPNELGRCPKSAGDYEVGSAFEKTATVITLAFSTTERLTCHAEIAWRVEATGGTEGISVQAKVLKFRLNECTLDPFSTACTASEGKEWSGTVAATGDAGNGSFKVKSPTLTTITCGLSKCTYTTAENGLTMGFTGGNPASLVANEVPFAFKEGIGCPGGGASGKLSGTFTALKPTAVWVATRME
ncbi:MAG: hypothetical protein ACTHKT_03840 [Solirubrobacterales bacterium]